MDKITITQEEYNSLIEDSMFLRALESAGVDNWDGYDSARDIFDDLNDAGDETRH